MIYARELILPSEVAEIKVIELEKRTCFHTFYPFKIFPEKGLRTVEFSGITLLYGGNGSGKSTLLNVMAHKINATRYSDFNGAPLFDRFVDMCHVEWSQRPDKSVVLTSDDVFDYALSARSINGRIEEQRNELFDRYAETYRDAVMHPEQHRLHGLDDYERFREVREILSRSHTQSSYIKKRVARDIDLHSNGETAMQLFLDRMEEDALYLLDEPENSLSIQFQIQLAEYIEATARATRSQFIIATHSPIFLSMKNARIYNLDDYPASVCRWTDLPNVRRYFDFFMAHKEEF